VLLQQAFLEQYGPYYNLKTMICKKDSFQKVAQLSQGNNVLEDAASNIDGFLQRDTCVFQYS
jgi:hypothetical protein